MQHDEIRDLLAAYALGSVSRDERAEIGRHLATCDACRSEVADYEAVTGTLALSVGPVEPPVGFTDRVVEAAVGERRALTPAQAPDTATSPRWWGRLGLLATAAVIAALLVAGATVLETRRDSQRREDALALLARGGGIALTGDGDVIGRAAGTEFAIAGIDPAPEGRTYQLWLMRGDGCPSDDPTECELVSAGTFDTEDGIALLELEEPAGEWEDAAVTVEDDEGADFPTSDPFVHSL